MQIMEGGQNNIEPIICPASLNYLITRIYISQNWENKTVKIKLLFMLNHKSTQTLSSNYRNQNKRRGTK